MFTRRLQDKQIIQRLLKNGIKLLSKDSSQAREASLKKVVLNLESQGSPTSEAEDFGRCMRFLKEFGTGDTLSHNVSSMEKPRE